jgi:pimeloyl-ACP methyl ester carboxylesterase
MTLAARIHTDGGRGPTLLYVPGIDGTGEYLFGTAERLRKDFRLITLEYFDDANAGPDSYEHLSTTIGQVLANEEVGPLMLLAESFGGGVALQFALDHMDQIQGIALVNTFPRYRRRLHLRMTRLFFPLTSTRLFYAIRRRFAPWALFGPIREPEVTRMFYERKNPIFNELYARRLSLLAGLDLRARLPEISCPVLLFHSLKDRVVDSAWQAKLMASLLHAPRLYPIPLGGHLILPYEYIPWAQEILTLPSDSE